MKTEVDTNLRELLASASSIFWAGKKPPFPRMHADERIFSPGKSYRLPSDYHENFDLVYLSEVDLGTVKAWPVVVDEALRLLSPQGILIIRASDSPLLSVFSLKNQLFCWGGLSVYFDHKFSDGSYLLAVKNERVVKRATLDQNSVSFGVVTDGKRPDQLNRFINSVKNLQKESNQNVEIVICGPSDLDISIYHDGIDVSLIPEPELFKDQGWITRKKNLIVEKSKYENLVIAHDRYYLPEDFLKSLSGFGFDFNVMTCKQITEHGERAPDWVTVGDEWLWTAPGMLAYGDWSPYVYINGGFIIAKRNVLKAVPWNELLFWGQAEDVELTRRLSAAGYIPRFSESVTANTSALRRGSIEVMEAIPTSKLNYWLPNPAGWGNRKLVIRSIAPSTSLNLKGANEEVIANQGIYLDSQWLISSQGVLLEAGLQGELSLRLAWMPTTDFTLEFFTSNSECIKAITANGLPIDIVNLTHDRLQLLCPKAAFQFSTVLRLVFNTVGQLLIKKIIVGKNLGFVKLIQNHSSTIPGERVFVQANGFFGYIVASLKSHSGVRRIYLKLKQNEWLRNNPLVRRVYQRIRKLLGETQ